MILGYGWLILLAAAGSAKASLDSDPVSLRGSAGDVDSEEMIDRPDERELATCPSSSSYVCAVYLSFGTVDNAVCNEQVPGKQWQYAADYDGPVCRIAEPSVIEMVAHCNNNPVASVQFTFKDGSGNVLRRFTETVFPFTVFGDDPTQGTFNTKVLAPGTYSVSMVVRNSARCTMWSGTNTFSVTNEYCSEDCTGTIDNRSNGHKYLAYPTRYGAGPWTEANCYTKTKPKCCGVYPHLVTVTDADEDAFLATNFLDYYSGDPMITWLGLTDQKQEGVFQWVTGEAFGSYQPWDISQPDNSDAKDCVRSRLPGTWDVQDCSGAAAGFIMEYDCALL